MVATAVLFKNSLLDSFLGSVSCFSIAGFSPLGSVIEVWGETVDLPTDMRRVVFRSDVEIKPLEHGCNFVAGCVSIRLGAVDSDWRSPGNHLPAPGNQPPTLFEPLHRLI